MIKYSAQGICTMLNRSVSNDAIFALNFADLSQADKAFSVVGTRLEFNPTLSGGTLLGSVATNAATSNTSGYTRTCFVRGDRAYMSIDAFSIPITVAGTVTHIVIGSSWPILLDVGTDIKLMNASAVMKVGDIIACGNTQIELIGWE